MCLLWILSRWTDSPPLAATVAQPSPKGKPNIIYDLPYNQPAHAKADRRQTLDLYLPDRSNVRPPLVAFVHGGFWKLSDDEHRTGPSLAGSLVESGVAVALIRYRLAPSDRHPAQARDVAAAVAYLAQAANKYGYDSKRIFLSGHSAGAHLAALVALDPTYLGAHRIEPRSLAGVIAFSGIYDLRPRAESTEDQRSATHQAFGADPHILKAASPITHVRANAPPFLILAGASDFPGFAVDAKRFADALRAAGHRSVQQWVIGGWDHFSLLQIGAPENKVSSAVLVFLKVQPLPPELAQLVEAKQRWVNPPFSTLPFWEHKELIRSYPIDQRFVQKLASIYGHMRYELLEWPLEQYYAMDLFSYLGSLPPQEVGRGNYLITTNVRNEKQIWSRKEIEPYQPVIVIGMDDEKNLFRLSAFYRMLHEYSWKPGPPPPLMARPVGTFIYFLKEPPVEPRPQTSHSALTKESFRLVENDPLAAIQSLPKELLEALTHKNGCLYCHSFRGIGSQSHHNSALSSAPHGGFGLPLEDYPPQVWKEFLFNQEEVAANMGAAPNVVDEQTRQTLHDLVVESRERQKGATK
jgi:acetyl esterase/lipase